MMLMYLQNISRMCTCMPVLLAEDSKFWAFAMLSQQGSRATLEGTDGLNSLSPWFTIQTDRERNKEPERQSTTERDLIIEIGKKKHSKKGTLLLQSLEDSKKKWKYQETNTLPATSSGWKRDRKRLFTGVPKQSMVETWYLTQKYMVCIKEFKVVQSNVIIVYTLRLASKKFKFIYAKSKWTCWQLSLQHEVTLRKLVLQTPEITQHAFSKRRAAC